MNDQMQNITKKVETDLLNSIINNLKQNNINTDGAKKLAQDFLSLLPIQDKQDLLGKLQLLSTIHTQAQVIYLKYAKPYEEEERQEKLTLISNHLKNGQIDHALTISKGGTPNVE